MTIEYFWSHSIKEINDCIESYLRVRKYEQKVSVGQLFTLADAISTRVAFLFDPSEAKSDDDILKPWDIYPELFKEEMERDQKRKQSIELAQFKASREAFAQRLNEQGVKNGLTQTTSTNRG